MLKNLLIVAFTLTSTFLFASAIVASENQSLYQHMVEVNKEWTKQSLDLPFLEKEISFQNDVQRIQLHLMLVENVLRKRNILNLSPQQFAKRNHHLDVLNDYWKKGVFPKNIYHQKRQPYFIDHLGTACAVGHLVREDGGIAFAEKIKKENNYAYISELQLIYPELKSWADNNGFTMEELAWIQPGYPPAEQSWSAVGNGGGVEGHINVMKTIGDKLYMGGNFSSVDGVAANSIISWDGNQWEAVGEGVEGEVFAIEATPQGHLIIGGNFTLISDPQYSNIAVKTFNGWIGLQKGGMNGSVYTLKMKDYLYAGGDFEMIDEQPIKYFAKRNISVPDIWHNNANTIPNAMEVNAPVRAIEIIEDKLLVGGDFTQTAPQISDGSINQLNTRYLAYWNDEVENWEMEFDGDYAEVNTIGYFNEKIAVGGEVFPADPNNFDLPGVSFYENDTWNNWTLYQFNDAGMIHGFFEFNEEFFAYGDVTNTSPVVISVGTYNAGFVGLHTNTTNGLSGGAVFDKTVRAIEAFQGVAYFAGDFTEVSTGWGGSSGGTFNGLVNSPLDGITSSENISITKQIQIYHASEKLYVNYEDLQNNAALNIYNLQGQILKTFNLQAGAANEIFDLSDWTSGMYVYQIVNKEGQQSGKFAAF